MFITVDSDILLGGCPFCSSKEAFKYKEGKEWMFLCHDCQRLMSFNKTGIKDEPNISNNSNINYNSLLKLCTRCTDLEPTHKFRRYCEHRKIPLDRVYFTDRFDELSNYAGTPVQDKERLILPFFDEEGVLFGMQGRSLDKDQIRYITIMFDKDKPKLFGLERIDMTKPVVIVEGPIDSFFVNNALAMAGSDGLDNKYGPTSIICFDNEPRSNEIVSKMRKSLESGYETVIWPDSIRQKDINDMVLANLNVNDIIHKNKYSGIAGLLKLNVWKR